MKKKVGFVPTMGALHQGHLSLIKKARGENGCVVVSIFVNPSQFGPGEDYIKYPRMLKKDLYLCRREGVDLVFTPSAKVMYQQEFSTHVEETMVSSVLCGRSRPGHFKGVCTVVAKLFNIVEPDISYFGQKDYQQSLVIRRMVENLNFHTKIKVLPIVREKDGLALSSRNRYLDSVDRRQALCLYNSLLCARGLIDRGERDTSVIKRKMRSVIKKQTRARIDYVDIREANNLSPVGKIRRDVVIALAVSVGKTRLIDNMLVEFKNRKAVFKL